MIFNGLVNYISEIGGKYTKKIPSDKIEWHFFYFPMNLLIFRGGFTTFYCTGAMLTCLLKSLQGLAFW
jgi:hypothetical protein